MAGRSHVPVGLHCLECSAANTHRPAPRDGERPGRRRFGRGGQPRGAEWPPARNDRDLARQLRSARRLTRHEGRACGQCARLVQRGDDLAGPVAGRARRSPAGDHRTGRGHPDTPIPWARTIRAGLGRSVPTAFRCQLLVPGSRPPALRLGSGPGTGDLPGGRGVAPLRPRRRVAEADGLYPPGRDGRAALRSSDGAPAHLVVPGSVDSHPAHGDGAPGRGFRRPPVWVVGPAPSDRRRDAGGCIGRLRTRLPGWRLLLRVGRD